MERECLAEQWRYRDASGAEQGGAATDAVRSHCSDDRRGQDGWQQASSGGESSGRCGLSAADGRSWSHGVQRWRPCGQVREALGHAGTTTRDID